MTKRYLFRFAAPFALLTLLAACAGSDKRAEDYSNQDEWMRAVIEYRKAAAQNPGDVEHRSRLAQAELKAADFYYQRGMRLMDAGKQDEAIVQFQQGLVALPDHGKLLQAMSESLARKESSTLFQEGQGLREAGKNNDALQKFAQAIDVYPENKAAAKAYGEMHKQEQEKAVEGWALSSRNPITLNFRQTDLKQAFEFLAKSFGVNVIFDEGVKSVPVTLFAKDVTFEQGLNLLLATTKSFYKKIGPNSILIAPDTKEKRGQYEDHLMRTFQLNTVRAKEMADILKGLITVKKIIVNEQLNMLVIRDTEDIIRLAERIIENNDRRPAEILLEVEILEVNRSKAERLGLDLGSYTVSASLPNSKLLRSDGSLGYAWKTKGVLTLPSATFRFFKQDVDAKILANPRVRVLNGKSAKIHIGDRVPLRAATIQDATGQVRTTFDYKDIGIRLNVEPIIHLDNSSTVKLALEVSSLGENRGTANEPAFSIGTRNAETHMVLRDGETAILGGLIRDEERNSTTYVPGIGKIPFIGPLFTAHNNEGGRTDVLLTITPRVVRGWSSPSKQAREFYSGTETQYTDKPLFADLGAAAATQVRNDQPAGTVIAPVTPQPVSGQAADAVSTTAPADAIATPAVPQLAFAEALYESANGQDFEIRLIGSNLAGVASLPLEILYNPQLLGFVRAERGQLPADSFSAEADATRGVIQIGLGFAKGAPAGDNAVLARVTLRGAKPGISYLVYRAPAIKNVAGEPMNAQVSASRVVIK